MPREWRSLTLHQVTCGLAILATCFATVIYAAPEKHYNKQQLSTLIKNLGKNNLNIRPTSEVITEINYMHNNLHARSYMHTALERINQDKHSLDAEFKGTDIPTDVLALSIVESGYRPLEESRHPLAAAGIWQINPSTAKYLGLVITASQDDRLNTSRSTAAALTYLNEMHKRFEDWRLAVIAYEYGENETYRLIHTVGSRDAWTIARSPLAPKKLRKYLAKFDASVIVMHNPHVVATA